MYCIYVFIHSFIINDIIFNQSDRTVWLSLKCKVGKLNIKKWKLSNIKLNSLLLLQHAIGPQLLHIYALVGRLDAPLYLLLKCLRSYHTHMALCSFVVVVVCCCCLFFFCFFLGGGGGGDLVIITPALKGPRTFEDGGHN